MYKETGDERYKVSALRWIKYILDSQYDTGGFPQVYPLVGGYPDAVTFNDDAMVRALNILTLISENKYPFNTDIISEDLVENINNALDLALDYLLNSQIVVDGQLTAWGQQHDPFTYEPRSEEHTSELQSRGHLVCRLLLEKKKGDIHNAGAKTATASVCRVCVSVLV